MLPPYPSPASEAGKKFDHRSPTGLETRDNPAPSDYAATRRTGNYPASPKGFAVARRIGNSSGKGFPQRWVREGILASMSKPLSSRKPIESGFLSKHLFGVIALDAPRNIIR